MWISADPAKHSIYTAIWAGPTLCELGTDTAAQGAEFLIIEKPRVYPGPQKADPNDLLEVAWNAGRYAADFRHGKIVTVFPQEWKRQLSKPLCHYRLWKYLSTRERALFPADTEDRIERGCRGGPYSAEVHNWLDAVGIGLWHIGRKVY